jgi:hypothetical protein
MWWCAVCVCVCVCATRRQLEVCVVVLVWFLVEMCVCLVRGVYVLCLPCGVVYRTLEQHFRAIV